MKKDIHPAEYRAVIFEDVTAGKRFLIGSTIATEEADTWEDGKTYPLYKVEISSASHPFYTGQAKTIDTAGRVEKFKARTAAAKAKAGKPAAAKDKKAESASKK
ncbi:type B 50S ribosomal protein L31 [Candidatus Kaiserbacteria bacterium CG10_big_fil_rev_8_21_14_0_10_59_10]|uniref:Large ribosomal subunit protein bL31B n=1 Tax=Candidatus Kaiserbacteria bacterium CG10_big_fil_rev_8_21_14_0_10_59_10 TaxID=1974612 RepID=A0A2H0U8K9_9BACT|nr:MAG: type B 50S ribosomal protein L31 [Candidatus Kaiserbacteria bacterium CG10_big_fil_rev_8_21_14_0_10_59_10]